MSKIVAFPAQDSLSFGVEGRFLKLADLRAAYCLSQIEAAAALRVPLELYEGWEGKTANSVALPKDVYIENSFRRYRRLLDQVGGASVKVQNLVFGRYALHVARDLLGVTVADMAKKFGSTEATWRKYESNSRPLSKSVIQAIEKAVREELAVVCP